MNLSVKQKQNHGHREETGGCQGGGGWKTDGVRGWDQQIQAFMYRTVELFSVSCDKPQWERIFVKKKSIYIHICITESLCFTAEFNTAL